MLSGYYRCNHKFLDREEAATTPGGNACTAVASSIAEIQKHCRLAHGWNSRAGRPKHGEIVDVPWTSGITCQRLRKTSPGNKPFQVTADAAVLSAMNEK
jgi:hypothetical protein